nr:PREDICTED: steroid 5-alpha-reductase DET2-like [Bemisia tabaci]
MLFSSKMTSDEIYFKSCVSLFYIMSPVTFIALWLIKAPYGKHYSDGWGPTMPASVAWFLFESPTLWLTIYLFPMGKHAADPKRLVLLLPFLVHYIHRTCVYPFRLYKKKTSAGVPVITVVLAFSFSILNSYIQIREISHYKNYDNDNWFWFRIILGLLLFLWGMRINICADLVLIGLKKRNDDYKIPRGGWFELVSCPNYFGEIVEWLGWAVMTWSPVSLGFVFFSCANLVPRARDTHEWYLQKFKHYPKRRKAIIPYLF